MRLSPDDLGRAVALLAFNGLAIQLDQHGVVHVCAKALFDRIEIRLMTVRGDLNAVGEEGRQVTNKVRGGVAVTAADKP